MLDEGVKGMLKKIVILCLTLVLVLTLTGCLPGNLRYKGRSAGFFWGLWHGWVAPVSLIIQLFKPQVRLYEVNNVGWLYDFGFYMAILGGFGGLSLTRRRRDKS